MFLLTSRSKVVCCSLMWFLALDFTLISCQDPQEPCTIDIECGPCEDCQAGRCLKNRDAQDLHYEQTCLDEILWWKDDCGDFSEIAQNCECGCEIDKCKSPCPCTDGTIRCHDDCVDPSVIEIACQDKCCGDDGCGNSCPDNCSFDTPCDPGTCTCRSTCGDHCDWTIIFGSPGHDQLDSLAPGPSGRILLGSRYIDDSLKFATETFPRVAYQNGVLIVLNQDQTFSWGKSFSLAADNEQSPGRILVTTDTAGNVYVAGEFADSTDLGGEPHQALAATDVFIASYDDQGTFRWSKALASSEFAWAQDLKAVGPEQIVLVGGFRNDLQVGDISLSWYGDWVDVGFVVMFDSEGVSKWAFEAGRLVTSIASVEDSLTITGGVKTGTLGRAEDGLAEFSATGTQDIFVVNVDLLGDVKWAKVLGGQGYDIGLSLLIDSDQLYLAGSFESPAQLGPDLVESTASDGYFLSKLTIDGTVVNWARFVAEQDYFGSAAKLQKGSLNEILWLLSSPSCPEPEGSVLSANGWTDLFLVSFDPSGVLLSTVQLGGADQDRAGAILVQDDQSLLLGGGFYGDEAWLEAGEFELGVGDNLFLKRYSNNSW
jgi:hypothetical protein